MLKVHAVLLALSLMVSRGKCTSASYQDVLDYSVFLTSLEVDGFDGDFQSRVLRAIHDGPNALKSKDFIDQQAEIECPEQVVRKDEQPMEIDSAINDIQNKLHLLPPQGVRPGGEIPRRHSNNSRVY